MWRLSWVVVWSLLLCRASVGAEVPKPLPTDPLLLGGAKLEAWKQRLQIERLRTKEVSILDEIERLDQKRLVTAQSVLVWQKRAAESKSRVEAAQEAWKLQEEICRQMQEQMRPRLRLFYRFSRIGQGRILLGSQTLRAMAWRWQALRQINKNDLRLLQEYQRLRAQALKKEAELQKERKENDRISGAMQAQMRVMEELRQEKQAALQLIYQEADLHRQALQEVDASQRGLADRLASSKERFQGVTLLKGRLPWPIQGFTPYCHRYVVKQVGSFRALVCEKLEATPVSLRPPLGGAGVTLSVPIGTPVQAVATGRVVYNGRQRGYGNLVILHHGQRFHTIYAHLDQVSVQQEQLVSAGEVIGLSGASGIQGTATLYFEIRFPAAPLPPEDWLKAIPAPKKGG